MIKITTKVVNFTDPKKIPPTGNTLKRRISTSNNKNIKEIIKKGIEKEIPIEEKGWNPHSKGEFFSRSIDFAFIESIKQSNKKTSTRKNATKQINVNFITLRTI